MKTEPTLGAKLEVLLEDLQSAASLAMELKQNCLASILYNQIAAMQFAMSGRENIEPALALIREMAKACCDVSRKYIGRTL